MSKLTLTLGQVKKLIKEARDEEFRVTDAKNRRVDEGPGAGYTVEMKDITLLNVTATVADGAWKVKGTCKFIGYAEGYDWSTDELEYEGEFEFQVNTHQINKYVEKFLPDWDPEDVTDEDIKEMLERADAYSIEDISQMIGAGWVHVKWNGALEVDQAGFDLDDRYLNGHNAEVGNFDISLYDKGSSGEVNDCYFSVVCDDFANDVEGAYADSRNYDEDEDGDDVVVEDYWEDQYDKRLDAEADYERAREDWAQDRFDDSQKGAMDVFWKEAIGGFDEVEPMIKDICSASSVKYKLSYTGVKNSFYSIECFLTMPDGKEFLVDGGGFVYTHEGEKFVSDGKGDEILAKYFKNGSSDVNALVDHLGTFEMKVNELWEDEPKQSDEFDYEAYSDNRYDD